MITDFYAQNSANLYIVPIFKVRQEVTYAYYKYVEADSAEQLKEQIEENFRGFTYLDDDWEDDCDEGLTTYVDIAVPSVDEGTTFKDLDDFKEKNEKEYYDFDTVICYKENEGWNKRVDNKWVDYDK